MKKFLFSVFLFFGLLSCQQEKKVFSSLWNFIPNGTAIVVKTTDFRGFLEQLSENSFFSRHELPVQKMLRKELKGLDLINFQEESLLCFSLVGRDVVCSFIAKNRPDLMPFGSIQNETVESFQYGNQLVKKYSSEGNLLYSVVLNGVFIASGSKLIVEKSIRSFNLGLGNNASFGEIYGAVSGEASVFIHTVNFKELYVHFFPKENPSFLKHVQGWAAMDLEVEENAITLHGILDPKMGTTGMLGFFKGTTPQNSELAEVVPLNAIGFYSFTYQDFSVLWGNLRLSGEKTKPSRALDGLFASANEIGVVYFSGGNAVVLNSKAVEKTEHALLSQQKIIDEFRGRPIFAFSEKNVFYQTFYPLLKKGKLEFYIRLGHFFVFSEKMVVLQNIIAHYQNGSVLASQEFFGHTTESLSDASSILLVGINKNLKEVLAKKATGENRSEIENLPLYGYKISALQFVHGDGFFHVHASLKKAPDGTKVQGPIQIMALKLDNPLEGHPQFFEYWRTGEQYIVAQDIKNNLYLFDNKGKLRWKKQLTGKILGEIKPVDLFKNTRLQMAFVTPHKFYVIDRNGNDVKPFPLNYKDAITQPLSIFDYAGNRNYRFVITQGKTMTMLDNKAERIGGFEFDGAKTSIVQAPNHIRIGTKDYIVVPEASGRLHILDRQGKPRIKVAKTIDFSNNTWYLYQNRFTSTNANGDLVQVDQDGAITLENLNLSENHKITATTNIFVSISENRLRINGKEVALDYGRYTEPRIFNMPQGTYIAVTDLQSSKVYLFDSSAKLLPGFPVYGNSIMDLGNMDNEGKLEFVVKGEDDRVLVYHMD